MEQMWPTHYQMFQGMAKAPLSYMGRIGGSVELMMTSPATMMTDVGDSSNLGGGSNSGGSNDNSGGNYGNDGYSDGGYGGGCGNNSSRGSLDKKNQRRSDVCSRSGKGQRVQQRWWWPRFDHAPTRAPKQHVTHSMHVVHSMKVVHSMHTCGNPVVATSETGIYTNEASNCSDNSGDIVQQVGAEVSSKYSDSDTSPAAAEVMLPGTDGVPSSGNNMHQMASKNSMSLEDSTQQQQQQSGGVAKKRMEDSVSVMGNASRCVKVAT